MKPYIYMDVHALFFLHSMIFNSCIIMYLWSHSIRNLPEAFHLSHPHRPALRVLSLLWFRRWRRARELAPPLEAPEAVDAVDAIEARPEGIKMRSALPGETSENTGRMGRTFQKKGDFARKDMDFAKIRTS